MKIKVSIDNSTTYKTPSSNKIKEEILKVLKNKGFDIDGEINVNIVSKNKIKTLNKKYRQIDASTDVLSFPLYDRPPKKSEEILLLGDIVICPEVLIDNAKKNNIDIDKEFLHLVSHSTLHLLGYHHK